MMRAGSPRIGIDATRPSVLSISRSSRAVPKTNVLIFLMAAILWPARAAAGDEELVRHAILFAYPAYELAQTRAATAARDDGLPATNVIRHRSRLSGPEDRGVTTPNNDTLYSSAWLDLSNGPVTLTIPSAPRRYYSVALMDMLSDHFAVLGARTPGGAAGRWIIAGPDWRGEVGAGERLLRAPVDDGWLIVRVLVDGSEDLDAARRVQEQFHLSGPSGRAPALVGRAMSDPDPARFLEVVNETLTHRAIPPAQMRRVSRFSSTGLRPGATAAWEKLDPATRATWQKTLPATLAELGAGLEGVGCRVGGWTRPTDGTGAFGTDDLSRAMVARGGLGALPRSEAIYLSTRQEASGAALDGNRRYVLTVPATIPVSGFWSLSMYRIEPDGRLFFSPNPLDRYAFGNRTPDLRRNADGSVTIHISHWTPDVAGENWLPAPPGAFALTFRAYLPGRPFLDGTFQLPAVVPLEE